ncbi:apoptosis-antagonizing transcription factor [Fusarium redolens]|uniref:Protein BFR2 n=1 Tax=Fusarium redolens TaxID=48865 RepID=A0A9P9HYE8_FUSRE|nr:apoptosis-antagonizing transcription factor [Fusarium redolens]KAH7264954.1 apoptosis-antagonizing transcription factor [Fusarium redolens]
MAKAKGRAKQFQDLDEPIAKDYDPEANVEVSEHGSGSEESEDENAGTEHYVSVGKSKLRKQEGLSLGPQYRGSRVSRDALEEESEDEDEDEDEESGDEEFDDPETADLARDEAEANDSEIESDDALGESDEERFKEFTFRGSSKPKKPANKRATAADYMSSSDDGGAGVGEDEDDELESDEDEMDDGLDALVDGEEDSDDESDENEDEEGSGEEDEDDDDSESDDEESKAKAKNAKPMMAALSTRPDVDKGLAIRQQRKAYDGLLNMRIRLQKALIAANTFDTLDANPESESEPYEAAEEAAIKLLNTISSLKDNFGPSRAGEKRKRELDVSMTTSEIWEQLQAEEQRSIKSREDRLEKWSRKVQSVNVTAPKGLESRNKTLVSALKEQLIDPDNRLAKRSRVPRSCAPAQAAKGVSENSNIYDDADFYQVLLKELVDQRTVEGSSGAGAGAAIPTVVLTAAKDVKSRKNVDRKASKGRKMRFTVHEKLQNFMAPEDRRAWEQGAIDRFFGTLFGRKMELNEDESEDDMDVDVEEAGLRLFRN